MNTFLRGFLWTLGRRSASDVYDGAKRATKNPQPRAAKGGCLGALWNTLILVLAIIGVVAMGLGFVSFVIALGPVK